jgi:hypothetical protein
MGVVVPPFSVPLFNDGENMVDVMCCVQQVGQRIQQGSCGDAMMMMMMMMMMTVVTVIGKGDDAVEEEGA